MKKTIVLAMALTLVLSGCARGRLGDGLNGYTDWLVQTPNALLPNVFVDKGDGTNERLIIDQEPIRLGGYDAKTIRWALRAGSEYQFPDKKSFVSILRNCTGEANLVDKVSCSVEGTDGKTLACVFPPRFFDERIKYCYSLMVRNTKTGKDIKTDPSIVSD